MNRTSDWMILPRERSITGLAPPEPDCAVGSDCADAIMGPRAVSLQQSKPCYRSLTKRVGSFDRIRLDDEEGPYPKEAVEAPLRLA